MVRLRQLPQARSWNVSSSINRLLTRLVGCNWLAEVITSRAAVNVIICSLKYFDTRTQNTFKMAHSDKTLFLYKP